MTTSLARRLLAGLAGGALLALPLAAPVASPATAGTAHARHAHDRSADAKAVPSAPVITKVEKARQGTAALVRFDVKQLGGSHWTRIQGRGAQWRGDQQVGACDPGAFNSKGNYIGIIPSGPGVWSFQVRVMNKSGWSDWSKQSRRIRLR